MAEQTGPRGVYSARLRARRSEIEQREREHRRAGNLRLVVAVTAVVIVWQALFQRSVSIAWTGVPVVAFAVLVVLHERILRRLELARRAAAYCRNGLARLDGKWHGTGTAGSAYLDPSHLYAQDLDLFGKGSVFEMLCTARSHIGEETLARWLLAPAVPEVIRARQEAVEELRPMVDLREDLAVLAEAVRTGVDPVSLAAWGESPPQLTSGALRAGAAAFSIFGALAFLGGAAALFANFDHRLETVLTDCFFAAVLGGFFFLYRVRQPMSAVIDSVEHAAHDLGLLSQVLVRLEKEQFRSPLLRALRASLDSEGAPPSARLARLGRIMEWLDSRDNVFVRLISPLVLYPLHFAFAVEEWRRHSGPGVRRWLEAVGEFEALCSLASHAFEHPEDTFPEIVADGPLFEAEAIGHPLIPESALVRNDVALAGGLRLLLVSGSNMSGKSTLLRTIGVNALLAQAGGTVRAARLRLSPLAIGASIRVLDSLQGGTSRFYAEIVRLRDILNATGGSVPVLFLLDEFLHGTNSHDRRIGAEATVRGLVERGAIGLVTTHDLALAHIADGLGGRARNVHFEDHLEDGRMTFDYRMHPGVVHKSNAIELMRSVGLEI
jgi:hypothetical protein